MAVPKKRGTSSRAKRGRSHHALKPKVLLACPKCENPTEPHRACPNCGYYNGRKVKVNKKS